jgi:hypothetical protein
VLLPVPDVPTRASSVEVGKTFSSKTHTLLMLSLVSDVVNPVAVLECTDSDSLPIQDLTSIILVFEGRAHFLPTSRCVQERSLENKV